MTALVGVAVIGGLCGCGRDENGEQPAGASPPAQPVAAKAEGKAFRVAGGGKLQAGTAIAFTYGANSEPGIVFVTQEGELRALSARCTHAGCVVNWNKESDKAVLHCPCHSSNFDLAGKVLNGPANKDLPRFKVKKSGDDALVNPV